MIVLSDIPRERVAEAVKALLDMDSLDRVVEVTIGIKEIRAVIYSTDNEGRLFLTDHDTIASHTISRRVV